MTPLRANARFVRRTICAFCFGLAVSTGPLLAAPPPQNVSSGIAEPGRERTIEVAREIMTAARYCALVTLGPGRHPQARIVDPLEPDASLAVYVATNPKSRKVEEIQRDDRVTLLYFDAVRLGYVTLIGKAIEIQGSEKKERRKKDWDRFFPVDAPDTYTLYRIIPIRIEVVSTRDGVSADPATWRPQIVQFQ